MFALISERLTSGQSSFAKEKTQFKLVNECKDPSPPNKSLYPNPADNSPNLPSTNILGSEIKDANQMQVMKLPPMMDGSYFDRMTVSEIKQQADDHIVDACK